MIPCQSTVGTRVEVLLKDNPHKAGGLLDVNSYYRHTLQLDALIGTVAPNLDVELATMAQDGPTIGCAAWRLAAD